MQGGERANVALFETERRDEHDLVGIGWISRGDSR